MVGPNTYNGGGVAPGPPAGGVRNNRGIQAQGRTSSIQDAIRKQRERKANQATFNTENQPLTQQNENAGKKSGKKPNPKPKPPAPKPKGDPALPPIKTAGSTFKPVVSPYTEKPDPRDENYYANKNAIIASYGTQVAAIDAQQTIDDNEYALTGARLAEYNRRRVRDMGEARLGSGSVYTGGARDEQFQNANDYSDDMQGRARDWMNRRAERGIQKTQLQQREDSDIRELETKTADQLMQQMLDESQNSFGDEVQEVLPGSAAENPSASGATRNNRAATEKRLRTKVRVQTNRIERLRSNLDNAKTPKQEERIRAQIDRIRKRRTHAKGKLNKVRQKD